MEDLEISALFRHRTGSPTMECFFCSPMPVISESELVPNSLLLELSDSRTSRIPKITNNILLALKVQYKPQIGILRPP